MEGKYCGEQITFQWKDGGAGFVPDQHVIVLGHIILSTS